MAQLTFTKTNNQWVAEFEATADFNLHIERNDVGTLGIYQRGTASGNYAPVQGAVVQLGKTYDADFLRLFIRNTSKWYHRQRLLTQN